MGCRPNCSASASGYIDSDTNPESIIPHILDPLPYAYDALEPFYDKVTVEIHHEKHHQAYVDSLNAALQGHPYLEVKTLDALLFDLDEVPVSLRAKVIHFGGGIWNHNLFWKVMGPPARVAAPDGEVATAIEQCFGGFHSFQEEWKKSALDAFGSGWTFLIKEQGRLAIRNFSNQDCPISQGLKPILALDVWEHAYYLKFQNCRAEWIDAWWNVVNWEAVEKLYAGQYSPILRVTALADGVVVE